MARGRALLLELKLVDAILLEQPLLDALERWCRATAGVVVPREAWDWAKVPEPLRPTYRVVDEQGREQARGKAKAVLLLAMWGSEECCRNKINNLKQETSLLGDRVLKPYIEYATGVRRLNTFKHLSTSIYIY